MSEPAPIAQLAPQPWMAEAPTRAVLAALGRDRARFVGGAVRDALLGRVVGDIDIATVLAPEEVMRRLATAGLGAVPTGLAHGTITAVAAPRHFEITSLRRDVESFGRHARVEFAADWAADAARRDFTMNALFMDAGGAVFDYIGGGLADLRAGRVRFVGDAESRIREDVLRLLRFYRFFAHYGREPADEAARAAARKLRDLLPGLSGERVAAEMLRLLAAPEPLPALRLMAEDGVLAVILPEAGAFDRLAALLALEPAPEALRRLAALIAGDGAGVEALARRWRLAGADRDRLAALVAPPWPVALGGDLRAQRRALHHLGAAPYRDLVLLAAAGEGNPAPAVRLLALAEAWQPAVFPLQGRDLTARGLAPGPEIGRRLAEIEEWWEAGDFRADRAACLAELDRRLGSAKS